MDNNTIARQLTTQAHELEEHGGSLYRVKAYRRAAQTILMYPQPVEELVQREGEKGLRQLPGVGDHLAQAIARLITTGEFRPATPGVDELPAHKHLLSLPGVGEKTAHLLDEQLRVQTIAELQQAAGDGRLEQLPLPARDRVTAALRQHEREQQSQQPPSTEPSVEQLLRIDAHYRQQAELGQLPTIAPEKFNPLGEAWLPVLYLKLDGWRYRVLFSNTALAHRLGKTRDWVVIYFQGPEGKGQRTVITEKYGDLRGRRVVRGREEECRPVTA